MAESAGEKTEDPTARRLSEARKDGNVTRSADLTAAAVLLAGVLALVFAGPWMMGRMLTGMRVLLSGQNSGNATRADFLRLDIYEAARILGESLAPLVAAVFLAAIVANLMQIGFLLTFKPLTPKLSKLDPIKGAANLMNLKAMVRLIMSLAKLVVIAAVATALTWGEISKVVHLGYLSTPEFLGLGGAMVLELAVKLALVLLVLALLDFWYQKWQRTQDLKMTKQEVRDESKGMDGDPGMKARRSRIARTLAMQRVAAAVPQADVVLTNPTHLSIALRYDSETMPAPKVIAKGADHLALKIRELANIHGVPIVERKPLARALYASVEVGQYIPEEHYAAAAEILAYVYRLAEGLERDTTDAA